MSPATLEGLTEPRPLDLVLEEIVVINAEGRLIVQTVWATMVAGRARGRRLTHSESVADRALLMRRLAELVPVIYPQHDAVLAAAD